MELPAGSHTCTICQVPVILQATGEACIQVNLADGSLLSLEGLCVNAGNRKHIFQRDGVVDHLVVNLGA
jgi:hypothetical protein